MPVETDQRPRLELAHVLFMDVVGYSKLPMDEQQSVLRQLQDAVRSTRHFATAQDTDRLIRLPTGDGMALVFFEDPEAPVRCAVELAQALRAHPDIKLRMGVHSGPVYRIADINANRNVSGGGINFAQRVMDCGDAGHILVSGAVAEVLRQLSAWKGCLQDLGEAEVKHGVRIHVFNLITADAGNAQRPHAMRSVRPAWQKPVLWAALAALILVAVAGTTWRGRRIPASPQAVSPAPGRAQNAPAARAEPLVPAAPGSRAVSSEMRTVTRAAASPRVKAAKAPPASAAKVPASQLAGQYGGQFLVSGAEEATATMMLEEQRGVVTGCLQSTRGGFGGGPVQGVAQGTQVVATVSTATGRTELQGQAVGNELRGTYTSFSRSGTKRGRFILQRQPAGRSGDTPIKDCPAS